MDFEDRSELSKEEIIEFINTIIHYVKTDDFYIKHGDDLYWQDGREDIYWALNLIDDSEDKRKVEYLRLFNEALSANSYKPYIINRTTTNTVKAIVMSGVEYEASLIDVESPKELKASVMKVMLMKGKIVNDISLIIDDRVLEFSNSIAILTDESVLAIVVLA